MSTTRKKINFKSVLTVIKNFIVSIPKRLRNLVAPQKVTWPTFKDSARRTGVVLVVSAVSACLILAMDTVLSLLLKIPFIV